MAKIFLWQASQANCHFRSEVDRPNFSSFFSDKIDRPARSKVVELIMAGTNSDLQNFNSISLKSPLAHVLTEIQSHGILLVLQEPDLKILQVSNNTIGAFEVAPSRVIGQPLEKFLDIFQVEQFRARFSIVATIRKYGYKSLRIITGSLMLFFIEIPMAI
jgi:hypothetical protein